MRIMDKIADSRPDVAVKEGELRVETGTSKFGVPLLDTPPFADVLEGFRKIPKQDWSPLPKGLLGAIYLCSFYTSRATQAREDIMGVAVDGADVLSTDGYRITWCKVPGAEDVGEMTVQVGGATLLPRYNTLDSFSVQEGWLCLKGAGLLFCTRLLGSKTKFPYDKVRGYFKRDDKAKVVKMKIPSALLGVVERALVYQKYEFLLDSEMRMTVGDGKILCEVESKDIGWFREQFAFDDKKVKFSVVVNPVFLKEVLQHTSYMELQSESTLRLYSDSFDHLISLR